MAKNGEWLATYRVGVLNTGVDDVRASARAGGGVVSVFGAAGLGVRDTAKTPRSIALGDILVDAHNGILLDELDLEKTG